MRIGFVPAIVKVYLVRKIGESNVRKLLLSGQMISAQEAQTMGLITWVVMPDQLEKAVEDYAQMLCREKSGQSRDLIKQMIGRVQEMPLVEGIRYSAKMNALAREAEDCKRGIASFLA